MPKPFRTASRFIRLTLQLAIAWVSGVLPAKGQSVFVVPYASQADARLYETRVRSEADIILYRVKYRSQADPGKGYWFDVPYTSQADWRVYWVKYRSQADCVVYFAPCRSQAFRNDCYFRTCSR